MTTDALLNARNKTHGDFSENARISQHLKALFRQCDGWDRLPRVHKESLDMIALKLSRILSGNFNEADHWADLSGYATLVVRDLEGK